MEITQHPAAESLELRITGRIDATWGEHLGDTIENAVRAGSHRIVLNFAGVDYISSLGISVLFSQYRLLKSVNGSLAISNPNKLCRTIFTTVGLTGLLAGDETTAAASTAPRSTAELARGAATYTVYPQPAAQPLSCTLVGHPGHLASSGFAESDCRSLTFAAGSFGLGLGAFGEGFADCRNRFGEFLAAGGCAIALPTSEPDALPDFVVEQGAHIPRIEALYALSGQGDFSTMVRFDALADGPGKIGLSELVDSLLHIAAVEAIAFVVLAEAAGLVGATLRKSPAGLPLAHRLPAVREWLSFTTERTTEKSLSLLVGIAGRNFPERPPRSCAPLSPSVQHGSAAAGAHTRRRLSLSPGATGRAAVRGRRRQHAGGLVAQRCPASDARLAPFRGRRRNRPGARRLLAWPAP